VLVRTNLMHFLKELSKWLFIHYRYGWKTKELQTS
jgi:hypothetical protein